MVEHYDSPHGTQVPIGRRRPGTAPFVAISLVSLTCAVFTLITLQLTAPVPATLVIPESGLEPTEPESDTGPGFTEPATGSSDGGELEIEEFGHSVIERSSGRPLVSWGAIIVNGSNEMAGYARLRVLFFDQNDAPIDTGNSYVDVPVIPPGESVGVGDVTTARDPGITDVRFEVSEPGWWHPDSPKPIAAMPTGEVQTQWAPGNRPPLEWDDPPTDREPDKNDRFYLRFHIDSHHHGIVKSAGVIAVYRDGDGAIVGATRARSLEDPDIIPPGSSYQLMKSGEDPPPGFESVEVYVYL